MRKRWQAFYWLLNLGLILVPLSSQAVKITENGVPMAKIIIEHDQPNTTNYFTMVKYAAEELRDYIQKISGARLEIIEVPADYRPEIIESENYIFVGESPYTRQLGLKVSDLKPDGFRMTAKKNWLAIIGRDYKGKPVYPSLTYPPGREDCSYYGKNTGLSKYGEAGSFYAVYNYLESLGIRWFMPGDIGEVLSKRETIEVGEVNYQREPDYDYRYWHGFRASKDDEAMRWYRRAGFGAPMPVEINHSWWFFSREHLQYHPFKDKEHPEYFALKKDGTRNLKVDNEGSLCLSAPGLVEQWVQDIRRHFDRFHQSKIYPVMPNDGMEDKWCVCPECTVQYELSKEGNERYSKYVWGFVNKVAQKIYKTHPDRLIGCAAYESYEFPDGIEKFSPNVAITIAPLGNPRGNPWSGSGHSLKYYIDIWKERGVRIYTWEYYEFYWQYDPPDAIPVIFPHAIAQDFKNFKGILNGEFLEAETSYYRETQRFNDRAKMHLNLYVQGKLMWDASADVERLLDDYYEKFYGPAREEMKQFFTRAEEHWQRMRDSLEYRRTRMVYADELIDELLGYLRKALAKTGDDIYRKRIGMLYLECAEMRDARLKRMVEITSEPEQPYQYKCQKVDSSPKIDGVLEDVFWSKIKPVAIEIKSRKGENMQSSSVRVARDEEFFYFFFSSYEILSRLKAAAVQRDADMWKDDDSIDIIIKTVEKGKEPTSYLIMVNPKGCIFDACYKRQRGGKVVEDVAWDAQVEARTGAKGPHNWYAEVKLPLKDLGIREGTKWHIRFNRIYDGNHLFY